MTNKVLVADDCDCISLSINQILEKRAIFDTNSRMLEFLNEDYDCSELIEECKVSSPQLPYLAEILIRK